MIGIKEKEKNMKVLLLNGSTRINGCTYTALSAVAEALNKEGIETEILQMGGKSIKDCIACGKCIDKGKCVFDDDIANTFIEKAKTADGFVFGTPVYYSHPSGQIQAILDRVFYAGGKNFAHKPAAVVASARRAGNVISVDTLQKHLTINQMPIVSSTYWNIVFGKTPDEVKQDLEGMQTMTNLGNNMAYLLKCIEIAKKNGINPPNNAQSIKTNFIR